MSGQHTKAVWAGSVHRGTHLTMMLAIAWRAKDNGIASDVSVETLASDVRVTVRQAKRVIKDLVASQELMVTIGGGRNNTNSYKVTLGATKGDADVTVSQEKGDIEGTDIPLKGDAHTTLSDINGDIQGQETVVPVSPDKDKESITNLSSSEEIRCKSHEESQGEDDVAGKVAPQMFSKLKDKGWEPSYSETMQFFRGRKGRYSVEEMQSATSRMCVALATEFPITTEHKRFFDSLLEKPKWQPVGDGWEVEGPREHIPVVNKPRTEEETNQPLEELQRKVAQMMEASRNA